MLTGREAATTDETPLVSRESPVFCLLAADPVCYEGTRLCGAAAPADTITENVENNEVSSVGRLGDGHAWRLSLMLEGADGKAVVSSCRSTVTGRVTFFPQRNDDDDDTSSLCSTVVDAQNKVLDTPKEESHDPSLDYKELYLHQVELYEQQVPCCSYGCDYM
jgi:hypothetical protein